jgi:hypothetical protein
MRYLPEIYATAFRLLRIEIIAALMAVDVASREQALDRPVHDPATCHVCQTITARRGDDDYVNSPQDDFKASE